MFEKHRKQKLPVKVSRPGGSKSGTLQKLEAERDQIRQQQAQRAAERKVAGPTKPITSLTAGRRLHRPWALAWHCEVATLPTVTMH